MTAAMQLGGSALPVEISRQPDKRTTTFLPSAIVTHARQAPDVAVCRKNVQPQLGFKPGPPAYPVDTVPIKLLRPLDLLHSSLVCTLF